MLFLQSGQIYRVSMRFRVLGIILPILRLQTECNLGFQKLGGYLFLQWSKPVLKRANKGTVEVLAAYHPLTISRSHPFSQNIFETLYWIVRNCWQNQTRTVSKCFNSIYVALSDPGTMQFSYVLGQSPHNLTTPMHWNAAVITFTAHNICHHVWKIFKTIS